jgi:protein involved in polysaccharide export with SLBB domain
MFKQRFFSGGTRRRHLSQTTCSICFSDETRGVVNAHDARSIGDDTMMPRAPYVELAALLATAVLTACGSTQAPQRIQTAPSPSTVSRPASTSDTNPPPGVAARPHDPHEMLYPGDVVRLKIYREPDLSGDYDVNAEGVAVFPKVGSIHVTDITTDSVQHLLVSTYSEYLRDPAIEVTPLRRVTVLGAVKQPGLYNVDPTMSIADAVAMAGGSTPDGNQKKVDLIRSGKKQSLNVTAHTQLAAISMQSGDELYVPERSWLSRNGYIVGAAIGAAAILTTTIISNGGF